MHKVKTNEKFEYKNAITIEIAAIMMIFFIALVIYWLSTTATFEDPLITMKNKFLTLQIRTIGISIIAMLIVSFFSRKKRRTLIRNLAIIAVISLIL